jgi:hypothetical protein
MSRAKTWVVYGQAVQGQEGRVSAVCEQGEWDELERVRPGRQTLIQSGFASEADAERAARGCSTTGPVRLRGHYGRR